MVAAMSIMMAFDGLRPIFLPQPLLVIGSVRQQGSRKGVMATADLRLSWKTGGLLGPAKCMQRNLATMRVSRMPPFSPSTSNVAMAWKYTAGRAIHTTAPFHRAGFLGGNNGSLIEV